jgi:sugar phosphate permease
MISSLTRDFGYSGGDNGIFGSFYIISGMIGSLVAGILLDKFQKFKQTLMIAILIPILAFILTFFTLPTGNVLLLALSFSLSGIGILPVSTISY